MLELLVVMGIMAILMLAVAPWFAKISQRNQVKSAGQELALTLAAARMRAVKRNLPARVLITTPTPAEPYNRVETFEQVNPTPIKVGEIRIPKLLSFPNGSGEFYPQTLDIMFGPDGRLQSSAQDRQITLRGVMGAAKTNDLPIRVQTAGSIRVLKPNPDGFHMDGWDWR